MGRAPEQPRLGEGDAALSSARDWFPRPVGVGDVEIVPLVDDLDAATLFALLTAEGAREWRHKVGVAGRADGSGKASTRLLASRGFILKTDLAQLSASRDELHARVMGDIERGLRAGAWHPSKRWALLRTEEGWLPLGLCRELSTLRSLDLFADRMRGWATMLERGIEVGQRCGLGLDLNPANFGAERTGGPLYYVDDELYPTFELRQLAYAIAARIPEESDVADATWRQFGGFVRDSFEARGLAAAEMEQVTDDILGYPLAHAFEPLRAALVAGLRTDRSTRRMSRAAKARSEGRGDRVCVLADVHANLPALEAVLAAADELGATSFLFLGDAVGYGPHPKECIERLAALPRATFVRGNHDHAIATGKLETGMNRLARACAEWTASVIGRAEAEWLGALPIEHRGDGWLAVHGAPRDPHRFFAYVYDLTFEENLAHLGREGVGLCFHGHTHVPLLHLDLASGPAKVRPTEDVELPAARACLVNPGSVGQPRDGDARAAFAIWEPEPRRVEFERVAYRVDRTLRDIERAGLPAELLTRLQRGS